MARAEAWGPVRMLVKARNEGGVVRMVLVEMKMGVRTDSGCTIG